ncbi:M48 family metalloprotease [Nonomuraea sp. NPDC050328]|uniref:M56 family metallopeptidase n=1 Tax=Nonomuraea sp. NPDC050328 TaxID=3364361 RepID=UPI0037A1211A
MIGWALLAGLCLLPLAFARRLAGAAWVRRQPRAALVLWQAMAFAAGLGAVSLGLVAAVTPLAAAFPHGMHAFAHQLLAGEGLAGLGPAHLAALVWSVGLLGWLAGHIVLTTVRTRAEQRRQRLMIDLVAEHSAAHDAHVLPGDEPVAYCVSGRVVLSRGTIDLLTAEELQAVLAHERAHASGRHDLVMLPFVALGNAFPRLPFARVAREAVLGLLEMLADDSARRAHGDLVLAGAIVQMITPAAAAPVTPTGSTVTIPPVASPGSPGSPSSPSPGFAFAEGVVVHRVERLLGGLGRGSRLLAAAAYCASALLVSGPAAVAVAPIMCSARLLECEADRAAVAVCTPSGRCENAHPSAARPHEPHPHTHPRAASASR